MLRKIICGILVALFVAVLPAETIADEQSYYTLAVVPSEPPVETYALWTPLVERLSREMGRKLKLKVYEKMSEFERDIWNEEPDFIFLSPIQTVIARAKAGYTPLVRGANLVSVRLFVSAESPIMTVDDLAGRRIAYVGNKSMCSVFIRHMLDRKGSRLNYLAEYTGSTRNVIKSVLIGKCDAGAVFAAELEKNADDIGSRTRTLMDSPKIAPHPLCAHPRVPEVVRRELVRAVLSVASTPDGAELFKAARLGSPVIAEYERDYKSLEEIDVIGMTDWGR